MFSTASGEWRALDPEKHANTADHSELVSEPHSAFNYIKKAFAQQMGATIGAMRLLAESFPPAELNGKGFGLYCAFRPEVGGWGEKAEMRLETILRLRREISHGVKEEEEDVKPDIKPEVKIEGKTAGTQTHLEGFFDIKPKVKKQAPEEDEFDRLLEDDNLDLEGLP